MDDLPPSLILEILDRLPDAADLARCRVASKTLTILSLDLRSLSIRCSSNRYLKMRSPQTKALITPFKSVVTNLLTPFRCLESIAIAVQSPLCEVVDEDTDTETDDLYLTGADFVSEWLPRISGRLKSLSISDFWIQSCWRRSEALGLISAFCDNLLKLELKNAWLSVEKLKPMPKLTSLILEHVRLDDENLYKVCECFPSLRTIHLIGVGGLREPKIHFLQLNTCRWTVSNAPISLTINAPTLTGLKLQCVTPNFLTIRAPLVSILDLSIRSASGAFEVEKFLNLRTIRIDSFDLRGLLCLFPEGRTVVKLVLEAPRLEDIYDQELGSVEELAVVFPNLESLEVGPLAWYGLETCFEGRPCGLMVTSTWIKLKRLKVRARITDFDLTYSLLAFVLGISPLVSDVQVRICGHVPDILRYNLILKCLTNYSGIRWSWEMWKEDLERGVELVD